MAQCSSSAGISALWANPSCIPRLIIVIDCKNAQVNAYLEPMWSPFSSLTLQLAFPVSLVSSQVCSSIFIFYLMPLNLVLVGNGDITALFPLCNNQFLLFWFVVTGHIFAHLSMCHFYFTINISVHVMWGNTIFFTVTDSM